MDHMRRTVGSDYHARGLTSSVRNYDVDRKYKAIFRSVLNQGLYRLLISVDLVAENPNRAVHCYSCNVKRRDEPVTEAILQRNA